MYRFYSVNLVNKIKRTYKAEASKLFAVKGKKLLSYISLTVIVFYELQNKEVFKASLAEVTKYSLKLWMLCMNKT